MKISKIIALILAVLTVASVFSGCNLARIIGGNKKTADDGKDGRPAGKRAEANTADVAAFLESAKAGDTFTLGAWEQDGKNNGAEPITWIVLYQHVGKALVISEKVLEYGYFKKAAEDVKYTRCLYKDSDLRAYLNGDFYENAFTDKEKKLIIKSKIITAYAENYEAKTYETEDCVFPLSVDEATRYVTGKGTAIHGAPTDYIYSKYKSVLYSLKEIDGFGNAITWWLRDMGDSSEKAAYVEGWGTKASSYGGDVDGKAGVRPAMWVVYNENDATGYENGTAAPKEDPELNARIAALKVGDKFSFGTYDFNSYDLDGYEDIEWKVVGEDDGSILLIMTGSLEQDYFLRNADGGEPQHADWSVSDLRSRINSDKFINSLFSPQEKAKLLVTHVATPGGGSWGRDGGPDTDDYLFIPSREEIELYFPTNDERKLGDVSYWLRSPDFVEPHMQYVYADGGIGVKECFGYSGVRLMARIKK